MNKSQIMSISILTAIAAIGGAAAGIFTYRKSRRKKTEPLLICDSGEITNDIDVEEEFPRQENAGPSSEDKTETEMNEKKENILL